MPQDAGAAAAAFDIAGDKLTGAVEIARFIGEERKKTFRLLSSGKLPAWKRGGEWVASKAALVAHYRQQTAGQATA
jgi:hypothetical protein